MFLRLFTVLSLGIAAFGAVAPRSQPPQLATPQFQLAFISTIIVDLNNLGEITIPEGVRANAHILGGNWTRPDGSLLANIVTGIGGQNGYIDSTGILHYDVRYTIRFVEDNKYGYITVTGFGIIGVKNRLVFTLESDSVAAKDLLEQTFYAPGVYIGSILVSNNYAILPTLT